MRIVVPPHDTAIEAGYDAAQRAVAAMSTSRRYGSELSYSAWRKTITRIDVAGRNGFAFDGLMLKPGATANLDQGTIILAVDRYFAAANWYGNDWRNGVDSNVSAILYEVGIDEELIVLFETNNPRRWAQDCLGWLATNRQLPHFTVAQRSGKSR